MNVEIFFKRKPVKFLTPQLSNEIKKRKEKHTVRLHSSAVFRTNYSTLKFTHFWRCELSPLCQSATADLLLRIFELIFDLCLSWQQLVL